MALHKNYYEYMVLSCTDKKVPKEALDQPSPIITITQVPEARQHSSFAYSIYILTQTRICHPELVSGSHIPMRSNNARFVVAS